MVHPISRFVLRQRQEESGTERQQAIAPQRLETVALNSIAQRLLQKQSGSACFISATSRGHRHQLCATVAGIGGKQKNKYTAEQDGNCIVNCNKRANISAVVKM
jgi:hypothetical protein